MAFPPNFQKRSKPVEGSPEEEALESPAFEAKEDARPPIRHSMKSKSPKADAMRRRGK